MPRGRVRYSAGRAARRHRSSNLMARRPGRRIEPRVPCLIGEKIRQDRWGRYASRTSYSTGPVTSLSGSHVRCWHLGDVGVSPNVRFAPTAEVCPSTVMEGERFPHSVKVSQTWTHPVGQISDLALDGRALWVIRRSFVRRCSLLRQASNIQN
jgi:hypothetical protein